MKNGRVRREFDSFIDVITVLVEKSEVFKMTLFDAEDWEHYDKFLRTMPDIVDIFMFD